MKSQTTKNDPCAINESLQEMAAEKLQADESANFNHFVETGEILPVKNKGEYVMEVLADLTSLIRPGPLDLMIPGLPPKKP